LSDNRSVGRRIACATIVPGVAASTLPESNSRACCTFTENDDAFGTIEPESVRPPCVNPSSPFVGVNGLRAFKTSSRNAASIEPRSGPLPGPVVMSMCIIAVRPPWFCAANWSIRGRRIDRICDFGGSLPPVNPSTRRTDPGGAMALSAASISSGSSGSAAICSRVSTVENAWPRGSRAALCRSRPTATSSVIFRMGSMIVRRVSPARSRTSGTTTVSKPGNAA
jgi:hypothetical protein